MAPEWRGHALGAKHLGFVVAKLDAAVQRLAQAGFAVDHYGGEHPHRRRVYFCPDDLLQVELIEYLSQDAHLRNAYG